MRAAITTVVAVAAVAAVATMSACGSDERGADDAETSPVITTTATSPVTSPATTTIASTIAAATTSDSATVPVTTTPLPTAPATTTSPPVFDFVTPASADGWAVTNDTVMGGVSSGDLAWSEGVLVFTGELSLANGGGFASIRSPAIDPQVAIDWSGRPGVRVQVDGDGRVWSLELRTDDDSGGWIHSFPTSPDGLTDVELSWASFEPVTRFLEPRAASEPLDPARIVTIAFYLVDGVEGPYRLGVRSIS